MNYFDYLKHGSKIRIKKSNNGKFSKYCGGKVTEECIEKGKHSSSAIVRKRATFADNARHWVRKGELGFSTSFGAVVNPNYIAYSDTPSPQYDGDTELATHWISMPETTDTPSPQYDGDTEEESPQKATDALPKLSDRMKFAMNYLMARGFTKAAAAGIVGVFAAESKLIPGNLNKDEAKKYNKSAGRGIGQWSNSRRRSYDKYMEGKTVDLPTELDYFIEDLNNYTKLRGLKTVNLISTAVDLMIRGYEAGSPTALATDKMLKEIYGKAHAALGYRTFNLDNFKRDRMLLAQQAYNLVK